MPSIRIVVTVMGMDLMRFDGLERNNSTRLSIDLHVVIRMGNFNLIDLHVHITQADM